MPSRSPTARSTTIRGVAATRARRRDAVSRTRTGPVETGRARELGGILILGLVTFTAMALASVQFGDGLLVGPMGRAVGRAAYGLAGIGAYVLLGGLFALALRMLSGRELVSGPAGVVGAVLGFQAVSILLHLISGGYRVAGAPAGGAVGRILGEALRSSVSTVGTALLALVALFLALVATTPFKMAHVGNAISAVAGTMWRGMRAGAIAAGTFVGDVVMAIFPEREEVDDDMVEEEKDVPRKAARVAEPVVVDESVKPVRSRRRTKIEPDTEEMAAPPEGVELPERAEESDDAVLAAATADSSAAGREPEIVVSRFLEKRQDLAKVKAARPDFIKLGEGEYVLPSIDFLEYDDTRVPVDHNGLKEMAARLVNTLGTYDIEGEVQHIRPGPVVTMHEFVPAQGTRLKKIVNLADDLTMSLAAQSVRIIAPIPGKNAVGIEVPNKDREIVYLKELIADDVFSKTRSKLTLALGKDAEGRPVAVDLARMPHLLVAGTTGSGKSVCLNAMIASLLYGCTPEEVRMIMVDPKMLELSVYEGIPHLLLPVVTDPKKANLALRWSVEEMERRYQLMADAGVKDILSFNRKVEKNKAKQEAEEAVARAEALDAGPADPVPELLDGTEDSLPIPIVEDLKKLPYIVVIIDEFADLMMCAPKEVEHSVTRLAQKARACGIHLILATQRPTTEVITGLIKSNFPSRIAFKVTNKINSIAILEQAGAEALLGQGDMLFADAGRPVRRLHGCLVQDDEIVRVVDWVKKQGRPVYDMDILRPRDEEGEDGEEGGMSSNEPTDDKYDVAISIVAETRQGSASYLQRRLGIGYNRAARMIERMEKEGIVGPQQGSKPREVLVSEQ